jgi:hypothetical protein
MKITYFSTKNIGYPVCVPEIPFQTKEIIDYWATICADRRLSPDYAILDRFEVKLGKKIEPIHVVIHEDF